MNRLVIKLDDDSTITYYNPALIIEGIGEHGEPEVKIIGRPDSEGRVYKAEQPEKDPIYPLRFLDEQE